MLRLEELRKKHKYSQNDVALLLGTTNQTVSNWEKGKTEPDIKFLKKIAVLFHVSVDYLIDFDINEKRISDIRTKIYSMDKEELRSILDDILKTIEK